MGCLPKKRNDKATVWGCFPLAAYFLMFAILQTAWPLYSVIAQAQDSHTDQDIAATISYILNGVQIVFGVVALASLMTKWLPGLKFYEQSLRFLVLVWIAYVIIMIVLLFVKKSDYVGVSSEGRVWATLLVTLIGALILCILACYMRSCASSLIMVIECGGTGFEKLNYKQLKTGVARRAFTQVDSDNDTLSDFNAEP